MITIAPAGLKVKQDNASETWVSAKEGVEFIPERKDGEWYLGSFNFKGWLNAASLKKEIVVPYKSQWGIGAQRRKNDCALASISMIASGYGIETVIDDLAAKWDAEDDGTTKEQVKECLDGLGIKSEINVTPKPLSTCLVWYRFDRNKVWDKGFYGLHWLVLLELNPDYAICHDPDFPDNRGSRIKFSRAEWDRSYAGWSVNIL